MNLNDSVHKIATKHSNDEKSTNQHDAKEPFLESMLHLKISAANERDQTVHNWSGYIVAGQIQFLSSDEQSHRGHGHKQ